VYRLSVPMKLFTNSIARDAVELIEAAFPGSTSDGIVDRQALSAILLRDPAGFKRLEAIIHPLVREREHAFLESGPD
jgi:dephospho-CoA kinase